MAATLQAVQQPATLVSSKILNVQGLQKSCEVTRAAAFSLELAELAPGVELPDFLLA